MAKVFLFTHDALLARAYAGRLRRAGFEVEHCRSAQSGLIKARQWIPEVILLDLHLPGVHGLQVLKLLRDVPWLVQVPVVILIDRLTTRETVGECLLWGAGSCLAKDDCTLNDLVSHVRDVLPAPASVASSSPSTSARS